MLSRRGFFGLLAGAAAIALDPERALWTPGARLISIPAPGRLTVRVMRYYGAEGLFVRVHVAMGVDSKLALPAPPGLDFCLRCSGLSERDALRVLERESPAPLAAALRNRLHMLSPGGFQQVTADANLTPRGAAREWRPPVFGVHWRHASGLLSAL